MLTDDITIGSHENHEVQDMVRPIRIFRVGAERDVAVVALAAFANRFGLRPRNLQRQAVVLLACPLTEAGQREFMKAE